MENKNNLQKNEVLNDQDIPVVDADRLLDSLVIIIVIVINDGDETMIHCHCH